MTPPCESDSIKSVHAALFTATWALYVLIHIFKLTPWSDGFPTSLRIVNWMLVATAMYVVFRPKNAWLFFLLVALQVISFGIQLPGLANCWMFSGLLGVGMLAIYAKLLFIGGRRNVNVVTVYAGIAPMLRWSLILLYGFAVLAKCNSAFFNVKTSCAAFFCELICGTYGLENPPVWLLWSAIPGTILVEAAIPILLLFKSTRRYGVALGLVFHTFIAHSYKLLVFDFSALILPLYLTFTTPELVSVLQTSRFARLARWVAMHRQPILTLVASIAIIIVLKVAADPDVITIALYKNRGSLWLVIGVFAAMFAICELIINRREVFDISHPLRVHGVASLLTLTLVVANGIAPYVGLKTGVAYTMFSNLRTEKGFENHLFVPAAMKVFPYQDETVRLLESSEPTLQRLADANELLLVHDLRARAIAFPAATVRYQYLGEEHFSSHVAADPIIGEPMSPLERKLLFFRSIPLYNHRHQW